MSVYVSGAAVRGIGEFTQVSRFVYWFFRSVNLEYNLPALASMGAISKVVGWKNAKALEHS